jgi:hypothetical protein
MNEHELTIHQAPACRIVNTHEPHRPRSKPGENSAFLDAHRQELATRFPDEFVAIANGQFIDHGPELFALGERVQAVSGGAPALIWFTGPHRPRRTPNGNGFSPSAARSACAQR